MRFLAVYDRALTPRRFEELQGGRRQALTLTFDISQWAGAGTTIDFAVTELDAYSYLFCQPTIRGPNPAGLTVQNIRIQVNGNAPVEGQAFSQLQDTVLSGRSPALAAVRGRSARSCRTTRTRSRSPSSSSATSRAPSIR